jgi:hypothetical protein
MSDEAKRLAEEVNQRQANQRTSGALQLHKAAILKAKGHSFWNDFASLLRKEVNTFNSYLNDDEYKINSFDDTSTIYKVFLKSNQAEVTCYVDIDGQMIAIGGSQKTGGKQLSLQFRLTVSDNDEIQIRNNAGGGGGVESPSFVALQILKYFASSQ